MRIRSLCTFIVTFSFAMLSAWGTTAQEPSALAAPPDPAHFDLHPSNTPAAPNAGPAMNVRPLAPGNARPVSPDAAAVSVGQPGLSFRYVQTFGVTDQAYPADTQYLNYPDGLFIDGSNNVYVTEDRGNRVLRYDAAGNNTLALGTAGLCYTDNYVFCSPQDVALDTTGNLWVADGSRVVEYNPTGAFSQSVPASNSWQSGNDMTHFNYVTGVAFDQAGHLFVSDSNNERVQVYTFYNGAPVYSTTVGVTGVAAGDNSHFHAPMHIAIDGSNRLVVADSGNNRVQRCTFSSGWVCTTLDSDLSDPRGVSVDTANNVYIADSDNNSVRKCTAGDICSTLIINIDNWPTDVATDATGNVYVAAHNADVVRKYDSAGNPLGVFKGVPYVPYVADTCG